MRCPTRESYRKGDENDTNTYASTLEPGVKQEREGPQVKKSFAIRNKTAGETRQP